MKIKSLKNYFNLYISVIIVSITIIGGITYGYYNYRFKKEKLEQNIKNSIDIYTTFLPGYLWKLEYNNVNSISSLLYSANPYLCRLKIVDEFNNVIFNKIKKTKECKKEFLIEYSKKLYYNKSYVGNIDLEYSNVIYKDEFIKTLLVNILFSILISLFIIFFISKLFNKVINKNIQPIIENLEIIASGNYNINFQKTEFRELNKIIESLNLMINEIRLRDKKNEELSNKLNILINSIPVGLFIFNERGDYIEINDTACEILGMTREEILSKKVYEYSSNEFTLEKGMEIINKIVNYGQHDFEWKLKNKDGKIIDTIGKGRKVIIGDEVFIVIAISDVTYLKKLEKELFKREKLEAVGILAGGIAHDFNNILTSISGAIELIQIYLEKKDFIKAKEKLASLTNPLNKAKSLTHQLLTFAKGGAPVKKKVENLAQIIHDTVNFVLSGSAIEVNYDIDENLMPVEIDPEQISRVIENIILNAKDAMNNKGKIDIKVVNSLDYVKISIKDYGPGISDEIKDKIWDPYFTTKEGGTGLGLSIVHSIIKKHGGEIKVYTEKGKYTDFQIFLPISKKEIKEEEKKKTTEIDYSNKKLKILFMEDDEAIQDLVLDLCKVLGYEAKVANNGEEAIEKYKNEKFDVVILDLTIKGGMGGEECIKELKKIDPDVKAIVYSGYSESEVLKNYKKYGFKAVLKKPFTLNELKEAIKNCLYS